MVGVGTVAVLFAGVGGMTAAHASGSEPVEITFSYLWSGKEAEALEEVIAAFNASQDAIVVRGVSSPDFQRQLAAMTASESEFDISDHFGSGVGGWAETGLLEPLDSYIAADDFDLSDFPDATLEQMRHDGGIYSMPIAVHTQALLYNKALLAEAGYDAPPETLEEWAEVIAATTKTDGDNITRLGYYNAEIGTSFTTLGIVNGGSWVTDGAPTPADPGNVAGLQFYVDNIVEPLGAENVTRFMSGFGEYASAQNPFYTGKVATMIDGEWQSVFIDQYAPELDYGVAPIPYPADHPELANATQVTTSTLFIPANAPHKQEAWEFMKYLLSEDGMSVFTRALGNLPSRTSLLDSPVYDDLANFDVWLDLLRSDNARAIASTPWIAEYNTALGAAFDDVANGRADPLDALTAVADDSADYAEAA